MTDEAPLRDPRFIPVDLATLENNGVLMAANEAFFWPLGLALTWVHSIDGDDPKELHVREWVWEDGHHETIDLAPDDAVGIERRERFKAWRAWRMASLPPDERT